MKAKEFLQQIRKLDAIIENKLAEKSKWRAIMMESATSITTSTEGERVQSSGSKQRMADAVDKLIDIEREIDRRIDELIDIKADVTQAIEQLNATEYDLLHKVYFQNLSLSEVADRKGKSRDWARTVHGRALQSLQRILDARK